MFQYANPDLPLGSAEQFLLTLASINELSSRLKLWVFKLDFDNSEVSYQHFMIFSGFLCSTQGTT